MAENTIKTYLLQGSEILCPIKDYPDIGDNKEELDVTTLSDDSYKYIEGLQQNEKLEFTANYDPAVFADIQDLAGEEKSFTLAFGSTTSGSPAVTTYGTQGKFDFSGYVSVRANGAGVNAVREMTISITMSSKPVFSVAS